MNRKLTRRAFLNAAALGVAGAAIQGTMTGCASLFGSNDKFSGPFKFLALSDMHITDEASTVYPLKVVETMNREGADLALAVGDLASKPTQNELELAKGVLDELKMPYYPVLGNHDTLGKHGGDTFFKEVFSQENTSYHFMHKGVLFIGLGLGCGHKERTWLKETLATIPADQPTVLFSHYPFAKGVKYRTNNSDDVQALFKGRPLLAMISGHWHGNTEKIENGILMTTTACCSNTRGNHDGTKAKGYRVFTIAADMQVTTEFKEVKVS